MKIFLAILVAFLAAVQVAESEPYDYFACLFETCECFSGSGRDYLVRCTSRSADRIEFPRPLQNKTAFNQSIDMFFVSLSKISADKSLIDYALQGLRIKDINLFVNQMETLSQHMLDGIVGLERLSIIEMMLRRVEPGAFDWISSTLVEINLVQSGITNAAFSDWLPELSKLVRLQKMDLTRNLLSRLDDGQLDAFKELESLNLERNKLEYLGQNLFKLNTKLKYLNLNGNSFKSISSALMGLNAPGLSQSLAYLLLDSNKFTELAELPALGSLRHLSLNDNMLTAINGRHFRNVRNLNTTNLGANQIETIDQDLGYYLGKLSVLILKENFLTNTSFLKSFPDSALRFVDLAYQRSQPRRLDDYSFERASSAAFLKKPPSQAIELDLSGNWIENFSPKAFCSRSSIDSGIERLSLSYSSLASMNKCMLRQLQSSNPAKSVEIVVTDGPGNANSSFQDLCGCSEFRLMAIQSNVNLTGICDNYGNFDVQSCRSSLGMFADDCFRHAEFLCPPVQTSSLTPIGAVAMIVGGVVAGGLLVVSLAVLGAFFFKRSAN